jgi:hypothetical protein
MHGIECRMQDASPKLFRRKFVFVDSSGTNGSMKATSIAEVRVWDLLVVFLLWIFAAGFQSWLFASLPF